ncbi:MAG: hypothetical protein WDZ59_09690 [Pirellulales bacterium]
MDCRSIAAACALVGAWLCAPVAALAGEPIRLHPDNGHYFLWREQPTVLITSGEHYGAVLNQEVDYVRYLDELESHGFNLTRTFAGTYREVPGSFNITGNTLAPAPGKFICPWVRSETPGASDGGNKFDLTKWDSAYFTRLKDFIHQGDERGVVVELVLFCTMYDDNVWNASPMNGRNNVNGIGSVGKYEVYSGNDQKLLDVQTALARKLATELNAFDNLYFEICNEPYERGGLTQQWNDAIAAAIVQAESPLPNKHLIGQGFPRSMEPIPAVNPQVSVLNFHAASADAVRLNYHLDRPVCLDETGGSDRSDRKYRTEGWEFIIAGGAVYDHLDFSFTTERPDGTAVPLAEGTPGGGGPELRRQLGILKEFIEGFDFVRMKPANDIVKSHRIVGEQPEPGSRSAVRVLAEAGKAYAVYVNGGSQIELELAIPDGEYTAEWINTKTGRNEKTEAIQHTGGSKRLVSPMYTEDIALRLHETPTQQ